MSSKTSTIFHAEIEKGYNFKVLTDILSGALERTIFRISEDGIRITDADLKEQVLFNVFLDRDKLKKFRCPNKPLNFSINLKHLQKLIKSVKKKDLIRLSINAEKRNYLDINIRQTSGGKQTETISVNIQVENDPPPPLVVPDYYDDGKGEHQVYDHPFVISSSTFQKIKKMTQMKKITVSIIKSEFIEFSYDTGLYSGNLQDGEKEDSSQDEDMFCEDFHADNFALLVKIPGLANQIRFYAPHKDRYPLKVGCDIGTFGEMFIYIKDQAQIEFENTVREAASGE